MWEVGGLKGVVPRDEARQDEARQTDFQDLTDMLNFPSDFLMSTRKYKAHLNLYQQITSSSLSFDRNQTTQKQLPTTHSQRNQLSHSHASGGNCLVSNATEL